MTWAFHSYVSLQRMIRTWHLDHLLQCKVPSLLFHLWWRSSSLWKIICYVFRSSKASFSANSNRRHWSSAHLSSSTVKIPQLLLESPMAKEASAVPSELMHWSRPTSEMSWHRLLILWQFQLLSRSISKRTCPSLTFSSLLWCSCCCTILGRHKQWPCHLFSNTKTKSDHPWLIFRGSCFANQRKKSHQT